ncbi:MAG TPA: alkaline phosphatase family protein [Candidatus Cybelea sp.]|nr:alkaline phosphatase family protein [Candidatus Cybelea sp.]
MNQALPTPTKHVVIVVQENRTPDFLFQDIPGADIANSAIDSKGERVPLQSTSLATPFDLGHSYASFVRDYDDGKMDGFDAGIPQRRHLLPFGYGVPSEVQPYHEMARQYVFADHMFATNRGPSFPAHLYLVSGTAGDASIAGYSVRDNPFDRAAHEGAPGGCDAARTVVVRTIKLSNGAEGPTPFACFDRKVLSDFLDAKGVSWKYYQVGAGPGLWHPFNAIRHVRYGGDWRNVVTKSTQFLDDVKNGDLPGVTWLTPYDAWSDHAGKRATAKGPAWVAAVVNAIGKSKYWKSTAILVTWDDWGGWYDHVKPPTYNAYELGFRVPLLVISPYARKGYVSKTEHEFASLLVFTEETFGIPKGALNSTDERADDLKDAFDFTQKPRTFTPIHAPPFDPGVIASDGAPAEDP